MLLEVVVGLTRVSSELGVESILVKCPNYLSFLCSPQRTSRSALQPQTSSAVCQQTHTCGHCPELTAVGEGPNGVWLLLHAKHHLISETQQRTRWRYLTPLQWRWFGCRQLVTVFLQRHFVLSKITVTSHDHALSWHRHMLSTIVFHWSPLSVCMSVSC